MNKTTALYKIDKFIESINQEIRQLAAAKAPYSKQKSLKEDIVKIRNLIDMVGDPVVVAKTRDKVSKQIESIESKYELWKNTVCPLGILESNKKALFSSEMKLSDLKKKG